MNEDKIYKLLDKCQDHIYEARGILADVANALKKEKGRREKNGKM